MSENARLKIQNTTLQREKEELTQRLEKLKSQPTSQSPIFSRDEVIRRQILHLESLEMLSPIEAEQLFQTLGISRTPPPLLSQKPGRSLPSSAITNTELGLKSTDRRSPTWRSIPRL